MSSVPLLIQCKLSESTKENTLLSSQKCIFCHSAAENVEVLCKKTAGAQSPHHSFNKC